MANAENRRSYPPSSKPAIWNSTSLDGTEEKNESVLKLRRSICSMDTSKCLKTNTESSSVKGLIDVGTKSLRQTEDGREENGCELVLPNRPRSLSIMEDSGGIIVLTSPEYATENQNTTELCLHGDELYGKGSAQKCSLTDSREDMIEQLHSDEQEDDVNADEAMDVTGQEEDNGSSIENRGHNVKEGLDCLTYDVFRDEERTSSDSADDSEVRLHAYQERNNRDNGIGRDRPELLELVPGKSCDSGDNFKDSKEEQRFTEEDKKQRLSISNTYDIGEFSDATNTRSPSSTSSASEDTNLQITADRNLTLKDSTPEQSTIEDTLKAGETNNDDTERSQVKADPPEKAISVDKSTDRREASIAEMSAEVTDGREGEPIASTEALNEPGTSVLGLTSSDENFFSDIEVDGTERERAIHVESTSMEGDGDKVPLESACGDKTDGCSETSVDGIAINISCPDTVQNLSENESNVSNEVCINISYVSTPGTTSGPTSASAFECRGTSYTDDNTIHEVNKQTGHVRRETVVLDLTSLIGDMDRARLSQLSDISEENDAQMETDGVSEKYQLTESSVARDAEGDTQLIDNLSPDVGDRSLAEAAGISDYGGLKRAHEMDDEELNSITIVPPDSKGPSKRREVPGKVQTLAIIEKSASFERDNLDKPDRDKPVSPDNSTVTSHDTDEGQALLAPKAESDSVDLISEHTEDSPKPVTPEDFGPDDFTKSEMQKVAKVFLQNRNRNISRKRRVYTTFIKYVLFFFNFICWVAGVAAAGAGCWMILEKRKLVRDALDFFLDPAIILCVAGFIIFVVAFFGFVGALRENLLLLKIWHISMTVFLVSELVFGALVFLFYFFPGIRRDLNLAPEDWGLKEAIKKYQDDRGMRDWIDMVQREMKCCGVTNSDQGYRDWQGNPYYNCSVTNQSPERCAVPPSCCIIEPGDYYNTMCGYNTNNREVWQVETEIFTQGCVQGFGKWLQSHAVMIGAVFAGVVTPQFIGIVLARVYIKLTNLKKARGRWKFWQEKALDAMVDKNVVTDKDFVPDKGVEPADV